jgi:pyrimidine-nucleoside phosphorylase
LPAAFANFRNVNFVSLLEAKRDGLPIAEDQIRDFISRYTAGGIPDYQVAAFLMAVYCRGLDPRETAALTLAMRDSGETLSFPKDTRPLVDKHSTGGVGDKVSLPLAPLLACLGFRVPMISGRGLGITGGTLDKLDSIPGFQTLLPASRIYECVERIGCVICGQTDRMVPADKGLYALRDVTGTVPSIPLIVASILSKKLAEGLDALLLDVKCGEAAFMPTREKARELGWAMVELGNACGVRTRALLTNMDFPLGRTAGNWLEVKETFEFLRSGANEDSDLRRIVVECAVHLMLQTGRAQAPEAARHVVLRLLQSGEPLRRWEAMLEAQGADLQACHRKLEQDSTAPAVAKIRADRAGFITSCSARIIGEIVRDIGGGRLVKDARIEPNVGLDKIAHPGEAVQPGDLLCRLHMASAADAAAVARRVQSAFVISDAPPALSPLILDILCNQPGSSSV